MSSHERTAAAQQFRPPDSSVPGPTKAVEPRRQVPSVSFRIHPSSVTQSHESSTASQLLSSQGSGEAPTRTTVRMAGLFFRTPFGSRTEQAIRPHFVWHPGGQAVTVLGTTVADGMVYVGRAIDSSGEHDASFIDPRLPVAATSASAGPLGYWPSYRGLTPQCRRRYLEWLASGKKAPDADIGYVFLYFYGLERRLLIESPSPEEVASLVAELNRLRAIYAANRSFDGYSRRLLEAVAFLRKMRTESLHPFSPDLAAPWGEIPLTLKVAIAREVVAGRPLGFDFAAAGLFGLREFWSVHRHVLDKGRAAFINVLRSRFEATFPLGFLLRNRKDSRLQLAYRGASAGLAVDLAARAGLKQLPDPDTLTWTKLLSLAGTVAQEIAPYTKALAYHPARANALYGLIDCPAEMRELVAPEARRWLAELPSPAAVPFGHLARHAIGTGTAKWTVRERRQIIAALAIVGYAMEPDAEESIERLEDETVVQVFRQAGRGTSRAVTVACAAAAFVTMVVKTSEGSADAAFAFWLSVLPWRCALSAEETIHVRARLAWLSTRNMTLARARRRLSDATTDERELCAWSATIAAGASGEVGKPQIAILEAIHDSLSVPRSTLYSGLHVGLGAAAKAADEPIPVAEEVQEPLHPIPPVPSIERTGDEYDRLAKIRAETERVAALLADIFVEEEPVQEATDAVEDGMFAGLDRQHSELPTRLLMRSDWSREQYEDAAAAVGLMAAGAMETINEWAFDNHGDALLEDGDPVVINASLLPADPELLAAQSQS
jgi:hypothetical protein